MKTGLINKFLEYSKIDKSGRRRFSKKKIENTEEYKTAIELLKDIDNIESLTITEIIWCLENDFYGPVLCQTCGKPMKFKLERSKGIYVKKYCSLKFSLISVKLTT